ncbi:hypothetical protein L3Q82_007017 [Scortum barcoo]|uniref:Uncharacterized protein n=1 Tax=Scortum barcoo TaxID=214431 RepID=A0ACB8WWL2_9TELE|nr:hypothetical protein L3Q82_007017 [Scortum barcoo]
MEPAECPPVTVEGSWRPDQTRTVRNKLQLYFQSKKKSSGGDCRVEAEEGAPRAAVYFRSEEVRERVLARKNHEIVRRRSNHQLTSDFCFSLYFKNYISHHSFSIQHHRALQARLQAQRPRAQQRALCDWILNFLTGRPQAVRMGSTTSSTLTLNTGAPQGCVLSPLLYSLFTHDCVTTHSSNTIIKFADDTTAIIGLITGVKMRRPTERRSSKTKELIMDFRRRQREEHAPLSINGTTVERVKQLQVPPVHISEDLTWTLITLTLSQSQPDSGSSSSCRLRRLNMDSRILCSFYRVQRAAATFAESVQSVAVVLDNVNDNMSKDLLAMMVENVSGLDESDFSLEIIWETSRAVVKFTSPTVASIIHKWKKFRTTRTLPRAGRPSKLKRSGEKGLSQGGDQEPDGHSVRAPAYLCRERRTFQKDNHLCSNPPIRPVW